MTLISDCSEAFTRCNDLLEILSHSKTVFYFRHVSFLLQLIWWNFKIQQNFTDNEWREPRKHLNLAFNLNVLKGFIPIFASYSQSTVQEMEKHANGGEFDLHFYIAFLTVQTVSGNSTVFSILFRIKRAISSPKLLI